MKPVRAVLPGFSLSFLIAIISQWINADFIKGIGAPLLPC